MDSNKLFTHDRLSEFVDNYKEFIAKKKEENNKQNPDAQYYKYYNFDFNPDGITLAALGRFSHDNFTSNSSWSPLPFKNGIDAWKMTLARLLVAYKEKEQNLIDSSKSTGLEYYINYDELPAGIYFGVPNMNIDQRNYAFKTASVFVDRGTDNTVKGTSGDFSSLETATNNKLLNVSKMRLYNYKLISVNWYGLFLGTTGTYNITCESQNCLFYIWIGDNAICEYMNSNSDVNNNKITSDEIDFPQKKYIPIRIQMYYFGNVTDSVKFEVKVNKFKIVNGTKTPQNVPTNEVFFNAPKYPPLLLYFAFVSENQQDFTNDQFKCVSMIDIKNEEMSVKSYTDLDLFYKNIRNNLTYSRDGNYDYNKSNRLSYGVIPDINIEYTIDDSVGYPYAYSIYKLNSDSRMGKIYQITGTLNENLSYPMKELDPNLKNSIISYSDTYRTLPGFYPNKSSLDVRYFNQSVDADSLECKDMCNKNKNCNHFFTYTSNKYNKCVIDTENSIPVFNRIPPTNTNQPIDLGSSSLQMRDYEIDISNNQKECISFINSNIGDSIPVENTSNYSKTFEYADYVIDDKPVKDIRSMGICGDEEFIKKTNEAADILFKDATYYKNGKWEAFQTQVPEQKYTDAIDDTKDGILKNLENERIYAEKMDQITKKHFKLKKQDIPEYMKLRNHMMENKKYDQRGDTLYFRKKRLPNVREKVIMDNNELYLNTKLVYTLGTVTMATLLILAIVLARD